MAIYFNSYLSIYLYIFLLRFYRLYLIIKNNQADILNKTKYWQRISIKENDLIYKLFKLIILTILILIIYIELFQIPWYSFYPNNANKINNSLITWYIWCSINICIILLFILYLNI